MAGISASQERRGVTRGIESQTRRFLSRHATLKEVLADAIDTTQTLFSVIAIVALGAVPSIASRPSY